MPSRRGDDFGGRFHQRRPEIPIVFLTAEADIESLKRLIPDAMVIPKPVDIDVLLKLLKRQAGSKARKPDAPGWANPVLRPECS